MSSPEVATSATTEPIAQPAATSEEAPAAPTTAAAATDKAPEPSAATDTPAGDVPVTEAPAPATEATPVAEEVKSEEDKKEKKHTRKPFADLLSKILKPHPHEKPTSEKKDVTDAPTPITEESAPAPAPEATAENTEAVTETPAEAPAAEESPKDASSPRKERNNIFEKLTALVMKPKSPKLKKADAPKEDGDEIPAVEGSAEPQPTEDVAVSPDLPVGETAEASPVETPAPTGAATETTEEPKTEKKEKTPKDLAKLARRFSGRLFGVEKKKDTKRPEPTPEEVEVAASSEAAAADAVTSHVPPQIPADTTSVEPSSEAPQSTADSAPVIAAAA